LTTRAVKTVVPFGPQHPVLPEPIHLNLELEDEKVIGVTPTVGYAHRGVEKAAELNDFRRNVYLFERTCGICSFIHAMTYSQGIETLMGIDVPPRAKYLRVFWSELSRLHSHLLWLGLFADAIGFESLFMQAWRAREIILDLSDLTAGHRVIQSTCQIGGVKRDIDKAMAQAVEKRLAEFKDALDSGIAPTIFHDSTIKQRAIGKGVLTKAQAELLGAVGPVAKGSGMAIDLRQTGYAAYGELSFQPIVETAGDSYARMLVRAKEVYQSLDLIHAVLAKMPEGELFAQVDGYPDGEANSRSEQPRGEVIYFLKGNGTANMDRVKVRTPTFANVAALTVMLPGCELADVPVITLSIDPCMSCTDR
jgi:ech hydrogenase subunit E